MKTADVRMFVLRFREIMSDPSYKHGVTSASVCEMMDDLYKCLAERSMHVKMPVPTNHVGPFTYMEFVDENGNYPTDLTPRSPHAVGTDSVSASIVSRTRFKIRDASIISDSESTDKGKYVTMEIDDVMKQFSNVIEPTKRRYARSQATSNYEDNNSISHTNKEESSEDEMEDVDDEPIAKKSVIKTSSVKTSGTTKSRPVEIRLGPPASRSRITS